MPKYSGTLANQLAQAESWHDWAVAGKLKEIIRRDDFMEQMGAESTAFPCTYPAWLEDRMRRWNAWH